MVDCREHTTMCSKELIKSYPTIRLYVDGMGLAGDYEGHRTLSKFAEYLNAFEKNYEENTLTRYVHMAHERE
jgi:Thioredoxin